MPNSYSSYGATINTDKLTEEARAIAQPQLAFAQALVPPTGDAHGLQAGDTGKFVTVGNVDTQGGKLTEGVRIPSTGLTPKSKTYTIEEYGNSIPYTSKLRDLSKITIEDVFLNALMDDYQKMVNRESYLCHADTEWYAAMAASATDREFVKNATLTFTQDTDLDLANAGFVVQNAETENIPFWDGENYLGIISPASKEAFASDSTLSTLLSRDSGRAALNNEFGTVKQTRWVTDNKDLATSTGSFKEWFLVGADACVREIAMAVEIRFEDEDFGRSLAFAHYELASYFKIWDGTTDGQEHIIRVTSA